MKKEGTCAFGDHCPYAHNVFEYWLHPTRYRTQLCNDGTNCHRKICFFAHSLDELRVPACKPFVSPESLAGAAASAATGTELQQQQQPKVAAPPGMMFAPSSLQHHADVGGVRESLDVLLSASPTVIRNPESFSQHAARMATPFDAPAESTRLSSGSASSYASSEAAAGGRARSPATAAEKITTTPAGGGERILSSQEEQVVDMVTNLLAQDRLSAAQAASILQQMLPESSLATLQTRLLGGGGTTPSFPAGGASLHHQQQQHQNFAAVGGGGGQKDFSQQMEARKSLGGGGGQKDIPQQIEARESFDSARSSFDNVMRMSFENGGGGTPPRRSYDTMMVSDVSPPPAHPQYWLQQHNQQQQQPDQYNQSPQPMQQSSLFSVPEAFPMINAPRRSFGAGTTTTTNNHNNNGLRKSTGGIGLDLPPFPGAGGAGFSTKEGLDSNLGRLSFDKTINHTAAGGGTDNVDGSAEPVSNPFASILYESPSGGDSGGHTYHRHV